MLKEKVFSVELKGSQRFLRLFGSSKVSKGLRSGYVVLKPKESVGEHNTGSSQEVIIVVGGSGKVVYGRKKSLTVKKNSFIYIPPRMPHNVVNTGRVALKYVYTAARVE